LRNGGNLVVGEPPQQTPADPATQQNNARMLLRGLQGMLTQIDRVLPKRGQAVRQKPTELKWATCDGGRQSDAECDAAGWTVRPCKRGQLCPGSDSGKPVPEAARRAIDEGNTDLPSRLLPSISMSERNRSCRRLISGRN
jgi:hypothetical protein